MILANNNRFYVCVTRFNTHTFQENERFRTNSNFTGCVYGSPTELPNHIPKQSRVFIFEMNNDINKIMGVGYMYNTLNYSCKYRIYDNNDYNRYCYISKYRIDRDDMSREQKLFLKKIEKNVFYGSTHQKRGHGFNCISDINCKNIKADIIRWLYSIFTMKYSF